MSGLVVGRPARRVLEPSYFLATNLPVPTQDGVGCHDAGDGCEVTTAEDLAFHGETASLVVGQAQSSGTVRRAEDSVLLEQVVNDRVLVSIDPAGNSRRKKASEDGRVAMEGACLSGGRRSTSARSRILLREN